MKERKSGVLASVNIIQEVIRTKRKEWGMTNRQKPTLTEENKLEYIRKEPIVNYVDSRRNHGRYIYYHSRF